MRFFFHAATVAAITLFATATTASADGWGDNTAYRNFGWASATPDVRRHVERDVGDARAYGSANQQSAGVARADDEDRPQRRSRSAPARTHSVSIGSGGGTVGVASYYWQRQRVASGGWFNPNAMTAAHKTLPFGTRVRITHLGNGRSVTVTINDRGPYVAGRIIDLSRAAASAISMTGQGVARVRMTVLGR